MTENHYEWDAYTGTTETILRKILIEEIDNLERRRGATFSPGIAKHVLFKALRRSGLFLLITYAFTGCRFFFGNIVMLFLYMVAGLVGLKAGKEARLQELANTAMKNPDKPLLDILAEDLASVEEMKFYYKPILINIIKIVTTVLLVLMFGICAAKISAPEPYDGPVNTNTAPEAVYEWEQSTDGYILTNFDTGTAEFVADIPAAVDGIPVVAIGERAFENEPELTRVTMPDSITEIGSYAFKNCTSLGELALSPNLTSIGGEAFYGCKKLTSFTLPAGVTEIRGNLFQNCTSLISVTLHDGVTAIHAYAFNGCSALTNIELPYQITEIRANTFEDCSSLRSIVIPDGVTRIAAHAFRNCASLAEVSVPGTVTEIGSSAFRNCRSLQEIIIPENCTVDERSFKDSPTNVRSLHYFTQEEWDTIVQETDEKEVDVVYFVYNKKSGPEKVFYPGDAGQVVIADSEYFTENIASFMGLSPLNNYSEVLAYLESMKVQGAERVQFCFFSPTGSELIGEHWFFGVERTIDDQISMIEAALAES